MRARGPVAQLSIGPSTRSATLPFNLMAADKSFPLFSSSHHLPPTRRVTCSDSLPSSRSSQALPLPRSRLVLPLRACRSQDLWDSCSPSTVDGLRQRITLLPVVAMVSPSHLATCRSTVPVSLTLQIVDLALRGRADYPISGGHVSFKVQQEAEDLQISWSSSSSESGVR